MPMTELSMDQSHGAPRQTFDALHRSQEYLANLERISRAVAEGNDVQRMITEVVGLIRDIFRADRAWLLYPCDPEGTSWSVPVEMTHPDYIGAFSKGVPIPTDEPAREVFRQALASSDPIVFEFPDAAQAPEFARHFAIKSQMSIVLRPRLDKAWLLGMHQCSHLRRWSDDERQLFLDIAARVSAGLNTLLLVNRLEEHEKYLRTLLETIPLGVKECGIDGRILFTNLAYQRMSGYSAEDISGMYIWDMRADEQDKAVLQDNLNTLVADQPSPVSYIGRNRRKDGTTYDVQVDWAYKYDAEGHLTGFTSVVRDISDQLKSEERLNLAATVFKNIADGVAITDKDRRIVAVNQAFSDICGYTESEIVGEYLTCLDAGQHDEAFCSRVWHEIADEGCWRGELQGRRKSGEVFPERATFSAVRDDTGQVTHYIQVFTDITEHKNSQAQIDQLLHYDSLTGLPNRGLFLALLKHSMDRGAREGSSVAVLLFDINRFSEINDSFGHVTGDALLQEIAKRVRSAVRQTDMVARITSDEFAITLEGLATDDNLTQVAHQILDLFRMPFQVGGREVTLTTSMGISLFPRDGDGAEALLTYADAARNRVKAQGTSTFEFYNSEFTAKAVERLTLESALRNALLNQELRVHYQPQVSLTTGEVIGAEALIRWQHPVQGLVPPIKFLPLAEETGLIVEIGEWIMREACKQARAWQLAGREDFCIAVNVSPNQFRRGDLLMVVKQILAETGLPPNSLELEIVENALLEPSGRINNILADLHEMGVRLAIDDFGTGYSALSYLTRLPIHKIKIDKSFVDDVTRHPGNAAIVKSIISMASHLKLAVLAEGVEDEGQLNYLRRHRCDAMQGYYFSRPVPADAFDRMLRSGERLALAGTLPDRQRTLLVVDDEENVRNALRRLMRKRDYQLLLADSADQGFDLLARHHVDVVISDYRMPKMDGTEFLTLVKDLYPDTLRMVLSGYSDLRAITNAINRGAIYKYIEKPWDDELLLSYIDDAFRRKALEDENVRLRLALDNVGDNLHGYP